MLEDVKNIIPNIQSDSAWKEVLNVWFQEFIEFFYPALSKKIDWSAGYETLDKELEKVSLESGLGKRFVDKLIKVKSVEGKELWILLHLEVQGKKRKDFEERLFEYYYRLYDRYRIPIVTLVVLTDSNRGWRPSNYRSEVWGKEILSFQFFTVKLLDYVDRYEELAESKNPFCIVVLAQLAVLKTQKKTRKNADKRYEIKLNLIEKLRHCGLERHAILSLYKFIDWILTLPKDLAIRYNDHTHRTGEKHTMAYISTAERIGMEKGYQLGIEKGIEKGLGYERTLVNKLLARRFGDLSSNTVQKLEQASPDTLLSWGEKILDAKTIDEVFEE